MTPCACGCGQVVRPGCRYIHGHRDTWQEVQRRSAEWQVSEEGQRMIAAFAEVYPWP